MTFVTLAIFCYELTTLLAITRPIASGRPKNRYEHPYVGQWVFCAPALSCIHREGNGFRWSRRARGSGNSSDAQQIFVWKSPGFIWRQRHWQLRRMFLYAPFTGWSVILLILERSSSKEARWFSVLDWRFRRRWRLRCSARETVPACRTHVVPRFDTVVAG